MDRNSQANEFTGVAGFLCGLDDEPPISGPAAAAAFLQHGLDNDPAFQFGRPPGLQPTSWQELARAYPPNTRDQRGKACTHGIEKSSTHLQNSVSSQESSQRELEVHCETEENGNKVDQIERFMINLEGELRVPIHVSDNLVDRRELRIPYRLFHCRKFSSTEAMPPSYVQTLLDCVSQSFFFVAKPLLTSYSVRLTVALK